MAVLALTAYGAGWSQDLARIYVYAQRETPARSWLPILCDGTPVAKIKRGTFFALNVPVGRHVISSTTGVSSFVDVRAGHEYFVRLNWQLEHGEPPILVFDSIPATVARNEMRFVVYVDSKEVMAGSVPKTDPRPAPELHFKRRDEQP